MSNNYTNNFTKLLFGLSAAAMLFFVEGRFVFAQLPPAISPWLHMNDRRSGGSLGPYLGVVKPYQDMARTQALQNQQIQAQQRSLAQMQGAMQSGSTAGPRELLDMGTAGGASGNNSLLSAPREIPRIQRNPAGWNQSLHYPPGAVMRRQVPYFSSPGGR